MIEVSVIIPIYNVEKYIEKCILSVLSQAVRNIEIILVNDGSLDNSAKICEKYARQEVRIKYISTPNQGVGAARNLGMNLASGKWLCFVDGDDYLPADALGNLLHCADGADIVIGDYFEDRDGQIVPRKPARGGSAEQKSQRYRIIGHALACHNCRGAKGIYNTNTPWGKLYRSSFCRRNHLTFPAVKQSEDVIFNINAYQATDRIRFTERKVYYYRYRPDSVEHRYIPDLENTAELFLSTLRKALRVDESSEFIDFYHYRKMRFVIRSIRRSYAHVSCPMSRLEKIRGIQGLCEICRIKPGDFKLEKELASISQRFLAWVLLKGHYGIALCLFEIQRELLGYT